ncbi:erythromycin esterase family protein [Salininema proteolyticum]|uniref:Erythromycin esterase family protein n=1 Tax=Salininema proteolyticum TaxID=1607685 RepID=A0ABV8U1Z4_9ACTN
MDRTWIEENARPLGDTDDIVMAAREASVIGIGETTREAAEIDRQRNVLFQRLVLEAGYRILVVPDDAGVAGRMDDFAGGRRNDVRDVVKSAWKPNQSRSVEDLLVWIRAFNDGRPEDPVRVKGNRPATAEPRHYDEVLDFARDSDPVVAGRLEELYGVIRTAHDTAEHLQIHHGTHPGRPFADRAREAVELLEALPTPSGRNPVLDTAGLILAYHETSVAASFDFHELSRSVAERVIGYREQSGEKIVYLDGVALTGVMTAMETAVKPDAYFRSAGSRLRECFGGGYLSVLMAFGHGTIRGGMRIPVPPADYAERGLLDAGTDGLALDLRFAPDGGWADRTAKVRIIAGVYDPAEDAAHRVEVRSLKETADFLTFVPEISETEFVR